MGFIPAWLKTEAVVLERVVEAQSRAGGVDEEVVQTEPSRMVEIRPLKRSNQLPQVVEGLALPIATHHVRDDVAVPWVDPRTGHQRKDLDPSWRIRWSPSDGSGTRVLMPTTNSRWCPITKHWATECIEVL